MNVIVSSFLRFRWILVVCLAAGIGQAQSGRRPPGRVEPPVIRIETLEVVVPLLAYDANGAFVDDLKPGEVVVLEENEARPTSGLKREPANILLLLDGSNEFGTFKNGPTQRYGGEERPVWEKRTEGLLVANPTAREFAFSLLRQISPHDRVAIIQYSDRVQVLQDWTGDREEAIRALQSKYRIGIRSTFFDALALAAAKLAETREGRRTIVLLSDGIDSASRIGRARAWRALEEAGVTVFVVGWAEALRREVELAVGWMRSQERFTTASAARLGELRTFLARLDGAAVELEQLADSSGGQFWLPPSHSEVVAAAPRLAGEIGAQYSLAFITERRPTLEDRRRLEVIPARPGLSLRSRRSHIVLPVAEGRSEAKP
ncbi:MAG: VWA domain-containing protein [Blastocatellia bacterium]